MQTLPILLLAVLPFIEFGAWADTDNTKPVAFYQIYYSDKPVPKERLAFLEHLYGAKLVVLPYDGTPPKKPRKVHGIVLHANSEDDSAWVIGDQNPAIEAERITDPYTQTRLEEVHFLDKYAPSMSPPAKLITDFRDKNAPPPKASELERIRQAILAHFGGDAILKFVEGFGSEGRLPTTKTNWAKLYHSYVTVTKPLIKKLEAAISDEVELKRRMLELPYLEGEILELILKNPGQVIAQKMVKINTEFRVHIVEGEILKDATFLRFEEAGKIPTPEQIAAVENAVKTGFLDRLPPKLKKISATPDVAITNDGFAILDLNPGIQSGFYYAEDDLYVAQLIAKRFTGRSTPYLDEMKRFEDASLNEKLPLLMEMAAKYRDWLKQYDSSGFWDRISHLYALEAVKSPAAATVLKILSHLEKAGLKDPTEYRNFLTEVTLLAPQIQLPAHYERLWKAKFKKKTGVTCQSLFG